MAWRGTGALLALAVVGGGVGFGIAAATADHPAGNAPVPLVAASPSYPQAVPITTLPDPDFPALLPGVPLRDVHLGDKTYGIDVRTPVGWRRSTTGVQGEWAWAPPGAPLNTYVLRIKLVGNMRLDLEPAIRERIDRLAAAASVKRFALEAQGVDSFSATYVQVNPDQPLAGYQRLTMERYLTLPNASGAQVEVAVTGRLTDRAGLASLLEQVSNSVTR
ncbi:MAG: hypothetical protein KDB63_19840 [Nocardioidaceae bacterium]|nr:hypothetical protein [Nocardioidaceae bacterium]